MYQMELDKCYEIGKYSITGICLQTYPCQHWVTNKETNKVNLMWGDQIYTMLSKERLSHPHFTMYAEYIRKRDKPTLKEIYEEIVTRNQIMEQMAKREAEQKEKDKITKKYCASSYLDRVKSKKANKC